ncbi:hypothetical protein GCM10027091_54030 [Streptomyces daliensis]
MTIGHSYWRGLFLSAALLCHAVSIEPFRACAMGERAVGRRPAWARPPAPKREHRSGTVTAHSADAGALRFPAALRENRQRTPPTPAPRQTPETPCR